MVVKSTPVSQDGAVGTVGNNEASSDPGMLSTPRDRLCSDVYNDRTVMCRQTHFVDPVVALLHHCYSVPSQNHNPLRDIEMAGQYRGTAIPNLTNHTGSEITEEDTAPENGKVIGLAEATSHACYLTRQVGPQIAAPTGDAPVVASKSVRVTPKRAAALFLTRDEDAARWAVSRAISCLRSVVLVSDM